MKERTLNEYRQTKEYQLKDGRKSFDPEFNDLAKKVEEKIDKQKVKLKKLEKEFLKTLSDQTGLNPFCEYQGSKEGRKYLDNLETPEEIKNIQTDLNGDHGESITEVTLEDQIQEIASKVLITVSDQIFHAIIEEMSNYDELNWGWFVQDDAPTALLDACFDHQNEIHYEIFQLVLQKLK